jgi:hypothetical protein
MFMLFISSKRLIYMNNRVGASMVEDDHAEQHEEENEVKIMIRYYVHVWMI